MYCKSCEITWELASIRCPDCGERLIEPPIEIVSDDSGESEFEGAPDLDCVYVGDAIPPRKRKSVHARYPIGDDELLVLIDSTIFGSAKVGIAVGHNGIYWNTDWTTDTNRTKLSWKQLAKREIELDGLSIDLGKGDRIDVAALGGDLERKEVLRFLKRLQQRNR